MAKRNQNEVVEATQLAKDATEHDSNLEVISECDYAKLEASPVEGKQYAHHIPDALASDPVKEVGSPIIPTKASSTNMEDPIEPTPTPAVYLNKKLENDNEDTKKILDASDIILANTSTKRTKSDSSVIGEPVENKQKDEPKAEHVEHIREKTDTSDVIHDGLTRPMVFVEEVDSEPHHGVEFGDAETGRQKDAQMLDSEDAEQDLVVQRGNTPDIANTAAEVAESAATLDLDEPPPVVSDEEAGRLGPRRMSQTPIPEVANTAAEVADSAAELDRDNPTPPISDDEAGRIDHKHLSETRIPEVANSADEVADVAATLDKEEDQDLDFGGPPSPLEGPNMDLREGVDYDSPLIPGVDVGPLLSHERRREISDRPSQTVETSIDYSVPSKDENHSDNSPPMTPEERRASFDRFQKLQKKFYPNGMTNMSDEEPAIYFSTPPQQRLKTPSPHFSAQGRSPSLGSITEEADEKEEQAEIRALPALSSVTSNATNEHHENEIPKDIGHKDDSMKGDTTSEQSTVETIQLASQLPCVPALRLDGMDIGDDPASKDAPVEVDSLPRDHKVTHNNITSDGIANSNTAQETVVDTRKNIDLFAGPTQVNAGSSAEDASAEAKSTTPEQTVLGDDEADKNIKVPEPIHNVEVREIHPDSPPSNPNNISLGGLGAFDPSTVPAIVTPFVIGKRELGQDNADGAKGLEGEGGGPKITIVPPTPAPSSTTNGGIFDMMKSTEELVENSTENFNGSATGANDTALKKGKISTIGFEAPPKSDDTAKTSSIECDTKTTQLKARKQPKRIPSPERSITPTSIRSSGKDAKSRNFLKAFWHVVFIDFFGGLLMKCFGGDRRRNM